MVERKKPLCVFLYGKLMQPLVTLIFSGSYMKRRKERDFVYENERNGWRGMKGEKIDED